MLNTNGRRIVDDSKHEETICKYRHICASNETCPQCKGYEADEEHDLVGKDVFLGGTCGESTWREKASDDLPGLTLFNPQLHVDTWNADAYGRERLFLNKEKVILFVMTPETYNRFSYVEAIDSAHRRKGNVYYTFIEEDHGKKFTDDELAIIKQIGYMVEYAGGHYFDKYDKAIAAIKKHFEQADLEE